MPSFRVSRLPVECSEDGLTHDVFLGDAGGLNQFGVVIETLLPGAVTALSHWHQAEDELVYLLEGEAVLYEGAEPIVLLPGDGACFPAGKAIGHFISNESAAPCRLLMVGSRAPSDVITYPEHGRKCLRVRALDEDIWQDLDGNPADRPF